MDQQATVTISREELREMIREAVAEAFSNVGIHHDDAEKLDEARADFRFIRRLRVGLEGAQAKVGAAVLISLVAGFFTLIGLGAKSYFIGK